MLASAVAGEKEMESMTGMVLVMVCVAASAVLPPERSVAVAVQVMISPSTPMLGVSCSGFELPRLPAALLHS